MTNRVGVWLDDRKALLVRVIDGQDDFLEFGGGTDADPPPSPSAGGSMSLVDERRDRDHARRLNAFFDDIVPYFRDADEALVFGASDAIAKFVIRLEARNRRVKVSHVESISLLPAIAFGAYVRARGVALESAATNLRDST